MKIYNTLTRKKEKFEPENGVVKMYVCGPTVYDVPHIGHARSVVAFDVIRRYFSYFKKYKVTFVSNITDVEDKIIKRAAEEGISENELASRIIPEYKNDFGALGILEPDFQPRATEYIPQMVDFVHMLMKKGAAYETKDGVYFRVSHFKKYGRLSGKKVDELVAGSRVSVDEEKENPEDFALWKAAKEGEPFWNGPKGKSGKPIKGRPGWHIECSTMSKALLGNTFDIHGGGIDLIFPHHEDEIAQSETANDATFAKIWMHNGHIQINKQKMSKSLGNFLTVKEVLRKYNPLVLRFFLLSTHYRMPIEFSDEVLEQAKNGLKRLHDFISDIRHAVASEDKLSFSDENALKKAKTAFEKKMDDDFEISSALAAVYKFISHVNAKLEKQSLNSKFRQSILDFFTELDQVLAVLMDSGPVSGSNEIEILVKEREQARKNGDFARADAIRDQLKTDFKIEIKDTPNGTIWEKLL